MTEYNIVITMDDSITYNLNLCNRLNFIIGDSAIGKSSLFTFTDKSNQISKITLNGEDITEDTFMTTGEIAGNSRIALESNAKLVILDERNYNISNLASIKINKIIKNKLIIVISRDIGMIGKIAVNGVTTGTNNYYTLVSNKTTYNAVPYFKFKSVGEYTRAITEDSKSGFLFMRKLCDNVIPLNGKETISEKSYQQGDLLLVDLCGLCQMVFDVWYLSTVLGVDVVDTYSFEWLVLKTRMFRRVANLSLDDYPEHKPNLERYITSILNDVSVELYGKEYEKGNEEYFDWLFSGGARDLLIATEYEYLLPPNLINGKNNKALSIQERAKLITEL